MRLGIATDHGGFDLKEDLLAHLRVVGHELVDSGPHRLDVCDDYPDFVIPLAHAVADGKVEPRYRGLRQRRRSIGVRKQNTGSPRRVGARSLLGPARRRRRSHEGRPRRGGQSSPERHVRRLAKVASLEPA